MWIKDLNIKDYRAFQKETNIELSKHLTAIAGMNGVGKSTILAILTNVGELPKKYKTIGGSLFRGEFSDVIMYDAGYDKPGDKVIIHFCGLPENKNKYNVTNKIGFRASIHKSKRKKNTYTKIKDKNETYKKKTRDITYYRYRLIPKKSEEHNNEKKVIWPSLYLGLSRLAPLGEYDTAVAKKVPESIIKKMTKIHAEILSEKYDPNIDFVNLDVGSQHLKADIKTELYGFKSNSSGQDNVGQIIEAIISFELLKKELENEYQGGILAIDEIDATLHPAAQYKLMDWLLEQSKKLDLQIVFTTHSLNLLNHLNRLQKHNPNDVLTNYLYTSVETPGNIKLRINPSKEFLENNLQETYSKLQIEKKKIKVLSEDKVAIWLLKKLINVYEEQSSVLKTSLEFIDINFSWTQLIQLRDQDSGNFKNYIFMLDPDMNPQNTPDDNLAQYIRDNNVSFSVNTSTDNVFTLPGNYAIEKELWLFLNKIDPNDSLFDDDCLSNRGITGKEKIYQMNTFTVGDITGNTGKNEEIKVDENSEIRKFKKWYKYISINGYRDRFTEYWMKENIESIKEFLGKLRQKCEAILSED